MIITTHPVYETKATGEQFIQCTYKDEPCGCKIIGGGTLQQPLAIKYCEKHEPINVAILKEKLELALLDIKEGKDKLHRRNVLCNARTKEVKLLKESVTILEQRLRDAEYRLTHR